MVESLLEMFPSPLFNVVVFETESIYYLESLVWKLLLELSKLLNYDAIVMDFLQENETLDSECELNQILLLFILLSLKFS